MTLQRKTPMVRTFFKDSAPKPAKREPRPKRCKVCRCEFTPRTPMMVACSIDCAIEHGKKVTAIQKAKQQRQERAQDKVKGEAMKTYPQLIAECQKLFNAIVRERDKDQPCICCGRTETSVDVLRGHGFDCGHYRSTGSAPHLRFNFDNAHRQTVYCNRNGAGRAVDYRIGLIQRIGIDRVEALEADNTPRKWTHDELRGMRTEFQTMLRQMKKESRNG